jgi:hypothetical protein
LSFVTTHELRLASSAARGRTKWTAALVVQDTVIWGEGEVYRARTRRRGFQLAKSCFVQRNNDVPVYGWDTGMRLIPHPSIVGLKHLEIEATLRSPTGEEVVLL